jgi:hypothetical protein
MREAERKGGRTNFDINLPTKGDAWQALTGKGEQGKQSLRTKHKLTPHKGVTQKTPSSAR